MDDDTKPRSARIDVVTRLAVVRSRDAQPELSIADLARIYGLSEASVRRILAVQEADRKETVRAMMLAVAADRLDDWERACEVAAAKGYHQPAKDWLEAAQAIEAKPAASVTVDARPTIVLNMPFTMGALKDYKPDQQQPAAIEAQAVPILPPKATE
jgi:hypothetical protein